MTNWSGTPWVFGKEAFAGLDPNDRQVLADWLATAKPGEVKTICDFTPRPWHLAALEVVIGVFESGRPLASWLLVRYQSCWVLATVDDDAVSEVCDSLTEALGLISGPLPC
ncbi:hypothetical protein [Rhodopila sp.]|uniref:hypothetical protein n=1 Tax=Rhodopila sp. TaxID=2480087 RepID=UPI003D0DC7A7